MAVEVTGPYVAVLAGVEATALAGATDGPRFPPATPPGQPVSIVVELRRGATQALLGRFRTVVWSKPLTYTLNGIGEAEFTWVPRVAEEPVAAHLIADGEPLTWRDADLEVWVWRAGRLVWCGPVVWQRHEQRTGRVALRAWSREGYIKRLIYGRPNRHNVLSQGYFDTAGAFAAWDPTNVLFFGVTDPPSLYRRATTARLIPTIPAPFPGWITTTEYEGPEARTGIIHVLVVARYDRGKGWGIEPQSGLPRIAEVIRTLIDPATGDPVDLDVYRVAAEESNALGPNRWIRATKAIRREAGYINRLDIRVFTAPGAITDVAEVEVVYRGNIGAYAGGGRRFSAWVAALGQSTCHYLHGGDWTYDVGPAGPLLAGNKGEYAEDHPDFWSLWEDASAWGDFWCPVTPERSIKYRARRGRHRPELRLVGPQAASGLAVEWDAVDPAVANEVLTLSDGMDGATREEGGAALYPDTPRIMRCEFAPPATLPRDLDLLAQRFITQEGGVRRRITASVAKGPAEQDTQRRTVPGAWVHILQPGDSTTVRVVDGLLDYTVDPIIGDMAWDPKADTVTIGWLTNPAPAP
jgi:hypothetical protein